MTETAEKKLESIRIVRAEDLPDAVKSKFNIFSGFVELRVLRSSPPEIQITPVVGRVSDTVRESFKKSGLLGNNIFTE